MSILFTDKGWEGYQYWLKSDKATLKCIKLLIGACRREPFAGIGKPEALKNQLAGYGSGRITDEHRLVYATAEGQLVIIAARHRY